MQLNQENNIMGADFFFRDKIPVVILGATGCVGQKFVQRLSQHPWFQIVGLCASARSVGKLYGQAVKWMLPTPLPDLIAHMPVQSCDSVLPCSIAFSSLDAAVAEEIESRWAQANILVISNSRAYRLNPTVPLVIGEVNADHLNLMDQQSFGKGHIVTNPNCSAIGLTMALKPLMDQFGLEAVHVVTLQALSGAGYPGVASLDVCDNVIPYIEGEEEKLEREPLKILGQLNQGKIEEASFKISAHCNRVPVSDGHLACVSCKLTRPATHEQVLAAWKGFKGEPQRLQLPSAPEQPLYYFEEKDYPQPRLHRQLDKEMAVSLGRLRPCSLLDYKFVLLSHNTMRGAVGSALLNAELLVKYGKVYW